MAHKHINSMMKLTSQVISSCFFRLNDCMFQETNCFEQDMTLMDKLSGRCYQISLSESLVLSEKRPWIRWTCPLHHHRKNTKNMHLSNMLRQPSLEQDCFTQTRHAKKIKNIQLSIVFLFVCFTAKHHLQMRACTLNCWYYEARRTILQFT